MKLRNVKDNQQVASTNLEEEQNQIMILTKLFTTSLTSV